MSPSRISTFNHEVTNTRRDLNMAHLSTDGATIIPDEGDLAILYRDTYWPFPDLGDSVPSMGSALALPFSGSGRDSAPHGLYAAILAEYNGSSWVLADDSTGLTPSGFGLLIDPPGDDYTGSGGI